MPEDILQSEELFREAYLTRLWDLLLDDDNQFGSFIAACANAFSDQAILVDVRDGLEARFKHLVACYDRSLAPIPGDDAAVFRAIAAIGFQNLRLTQWKRSGPWRVQFNHLRSLRPARQAEATVNTLHGRFDADIFNFNRPSIAKECFWEGDLHGRPASLFFNKFPFARYHGLLVPEKEKGLPQLLDLARHTWAWVLSRSVATTIPGTVLGYNALGAFASVNHLHFQMFIDPAGLPVMQPGWIHNGGAKAYPAPCAVFDSAAESWEWICRIHAADKNSYNLLYTKDKIYCFERRRQNTYPQAAWTRGFAWAEMAGAVILSDYAAFETMDAGKITLELRKTRG
jgi:hypothetical protein